MTTLFKNKKNTFIAGVMMVLCSGAAWGSSSSISDFDVEADVKVLNKCFEGDFGESDKMGQYKLSDRRYVNFDVSGKCDEVYTSLLPLGTDNPLGQRVFHERTYEVTGSKQVGSAVLKGLQAEEAKLFVRSSPLEFDAEYWALYELLVPVVPDTDDLEDKTFDLPSGESIKLSDLPSLHDEVGDNVFTQYFFAIYYREVKE